MFCANCGAQLKGALKFCPRCGNKLREIPGVVQEPAPSALKGLPEEMQNDLLEQQVSVVSEKVSAAMEPIETTTAPSEPAENTGRTTQDWYEQQQHPRQLSHTSVPEEDARHQKIGCAIAGGLAALLFLLIVALIFALFSLF